MNKRMNENYHPSLKYLEALGITVWCSRELPRDISVELLIISDFLYFPDSLTSAEEPCAAADNRPYYLLQEILAWMGLGFEHVVSLNSSQSAIFEQGLDTPEERAALLAIKQEITRKNPQRILFLGDVLFKRLIAHDDLQEGSDSWLLNGRSIPIIWIDTVDNLLKNPLRKKIAYSRMSTILNA
jgi:hypothetical protein